MKIWKQSYFYDVVGIKNLLHVILIAIKNNDKIEVFLDDKSWSKSDDKIFDSFVV